MSTAQSIRRTAPKPRNRFAGALAAVAALVAIAVATVFIALPGRHATNSARATARAQNPYVPLIQYRGTGQPPTAPVTYRTPGAPSTTGLLRAEHSYGAVP